MPTAAKQHTSYFNSINAPKAISQIKPRNLHALKFVPDTFKHIPSIIQDLLSYEICITSYQRHDQSKQNIFLNRLDLICRSSLAGIALRRNRNIEFFSLPA